MRILRLVCLAFLLMLTSCSLLSATPPDQAVRMAIAQQLTQTQQSIAKDLGLSPNEASADFKIENVDVFERQKVTDDQLLSHPSVTEAYKVRGTFKAKLAGSKGRNSSTDAPFELYLGTDTTDDSDVQTWFLMRP